MFRTTTKLAIFTALSGLLLQTALPLSAKPSQTTQVKNLSPAFQKAKAELPEDWYVVYRIVDRIARANGQDQSPWRVQVVPEYNINAFATDVNLVAIYSGIMDQLAGDSSAIACVVAHEMGHHVKRHIALGAAERATEDEKFKQEAIAEAKAEAEDAEEDVTGNAVGGAAIGVVGGLVGGLVGEASNIGQSALQEASEERVATAEQRIQQIFEEKKNARDNRWNEISRRQEFEADEIGYTYMAKAGFEPEGCLRVMEILGRTEGGESDGGTHPAASNRIAKIKELMSQYPPTTLAEEGKIRLTGNPLSYDLSSDGQSLRINRRGGGSTANDIDRLDSK
jgi:beta-barrel assembly-enhancing protease